VDIQSDLFYDYRTNVYSYPKWQAWMHERQPRLLVIWGKYDPSFDISEPEPTAGTYRMLRFTFSTQDTSLLIPKRVKLRRS
jgi:hypothetical protein